MAADAVLQSSMQAGTPMWAEPRLKWRIFANLADWGNLSSSEGTFLRIRAETAGRLDFSAWGMTVWKCGFGRILLGWVDSTTAASCGRIFAVQIEDRAKPALRYCRPNIPLCVGLGMVISVIYGAIAAVLAVWCRSPFRKPIGVKTVVQSDQKSDNSRIKQIYSSARICPLLLTSGG